MLNVTFQVLQKGSLIIRVCAVFAAFAALSGCSINVDTSPNRPDVSSTAQDDQIVQLQQELNEIKKHNENRVDELENQLRELELDKLGNTNETADFTIEEINFAKALVEGAGVLHDDKGFQYVQPDDEQLGLGAIVAFETDDGSNGMLLADVNDIWLPTFLSEISEICDTFYGADVSSIETEEFEVDFHYNLCLSSDYIPNYFRHTMFRTKGRQTGSLILMEWILLQVGNDVSLRVFVDRHEGARLISN